MDAVRIKTWHCPIAWHRYVKWDGTDAYCVEPGCGNSNVEPPAGPLVARKVAPVPRSVVTINLPSED